MISTQSDFPVGGGRWGHLCLPQIPSATGRGRHITTADGRLVRRFAGEMEEHEEFILRLADRLGHVVSGSENWYIGVHLSLGKNCGEDCCVQVARRS